MSEPEIEVEDEKNRPPPNVIKSFFVIDKVNKVSTCKECSNGKLKGNHVTNLFNHLKGNHLEALKKAWEEYKKAAQKRELEEKHRVQSTFKKQKLNNVKLCANDVYEACTDLICIDGRPFCSVEDVGFRRILNPVLEALPDKVVINRHNIRDTVTKKANSIRAKIKSEVKYKMISVKADIATYYQRSFMGINIQFCNKGEIQLRTITVKELSEAHTGEYIKEVILDELKKIGVPKEQIYSITTDNGANFIRSVKLMNEKITETDGDFDVNYDSDVELEKESEKDKEGETEENSDDYVLDSDNFDDLNRELKTSLDEDNDIVIGIRCMAHTLQLVTKDALINSKQFLARMRKVVKKLRTEKFRTMLEKKKLKKAVIDVDTRWQSIFGMLERLLDLKSFCTDNQSEHDELFISTGDYNKLEEFVRTLKPAFQATKALQYQQLTLSDAYNEWFKCQVDTETIGNALGKDIVKFMKKRADVMFQNDAFLAALYLDPRFQGTLTDEQKIKAQEHLEKLWNKVARLNNKKKEDEEKERQQMQSQNKKGVKQIERADIDPDDPYDAALLAAVEKASRGSDISKKIKDFDNVAVASHKTNILKYWRNKQETHPELASLAEVVYGIPPTQVSVERMFSQVKFILNPQRNCLKGSILDDIIIVRLHKIFGGGQQENEMLKIYT